MLIPTSEGPVGGVVSEAEGKHRALLVLLAGYGRPARSGINGFWTRIARELPTHGVAVLRVDYSREGETLPLGEGVAGQDLKSKLDLLLLDQVLSWFRARLPGLDVHLAGACAGARLAIEIAGVDPAAIAHTYLIVPPLGVPFGVERAHRDVPSTAEPGDLDITAVDPLLVERFRQILDRSGSWILLGERDDPDVPALKRLLGPRGDDLEVEIVPSVAIHFLDQPDLQREASRRLVNRLLRAVAGRQPAGSEGLPASGLSNRVVAAVDVQDLT